ncbi:MAG: carboxypeptidase M32 [Candidatus Heimdallarchaeota archaeon]|nr:carboxypeptidase M32 [Candidatus Heimdallarchaeota archaeon]
MKTAYEELLEIYEEIQLLNSISGVLYWDLNTYIPPAAVNYRAKQFQYLSTKTHKLWIDEKISSLIESCEKDGSLDSFQIRNVELIKRSFDSRTIFPTELVGKLASQSNRTLEIWKKAKEKKDFQEVLPNMEKLFQLNVEAAELLAKSKGMNDPYNALIDRNDPGFSVDSLGKLFDEVKSFLVPFVIRCQDSDVKIDRSFLSRHVPRAAQVKMVRDLAEFLQYDSSSNKANGRIDEVEHPLTIGCGYGDVRVTVKYHEDHVLSAFLAGAHECGHAIHDLQGKAEWYNQPIYRVSSPSFGESQSRLLENVIASSEEFWTFYYPKFQKATNGAFDDIDVNKFYSALNAVTPGFIRIQADEVTYILHIIIRFEIEREWFAGNITTKELPQIWNEKYKKYLGVAVPDDSLGLMQDLHWYSQYYGYFHGYGIGDIISAQITNTMSKKLPNWSDDLKEGNFTHIKQWLAENIHEKGGIYDGLELVKHITNEPLSTKYFTNYIEKKFSKIYNLK